MSAQTQHSFRKASIAFVLGGLIGMLALAPSAHATFPGNPGLIAFHTNRDGNYDIYTMATDGTIRGRLTTSTGDDTNPAWSADGARIAFTSTRDGNPEIYTMTGQGFVQTNITNNPAQDTQASWSPDGTKIAFVSNRDGNFEIYTMNSDGTGVVRLTTNGATDSYPNWSPDGTKIAFQSDRTGNFDIYTMNTDGTAQTDITNNAAYDEAPNYTPSSRNIYFDSNRSGGQFEVYSMDPDGTNVLQRTTTAGTNWNPVPSPSGVPEYVWQSNANGNYEIFTGGLSTPSDLTNNSSDDGAPDWQALNRTYFRPKGATPLRISLVPAYRKCGDPGSNAGYSHHQGSVNSSACYEPRSESAYLQLGTLDYNNQAANSVGSVRFDAKASPTTDGTIAVSYTDVRCADISGGCTGVPGSDYTGDLYFDSTFRITDKGNGPFFTGRSVNGTVDDIYLRFSVPCASTSSTTIGSTCAVNTTINSVLGSSAILSGQRAIWQLVGGINLWDGGADGVGQTMGDDTLFAVGGLFFP